LKEHSGKGKPGTEKYRALVLIWKTIKKRKIAMTLFKVLDVIYSVVLSMPQPYMIHKGGGYW
jgi:hypothetical protein